MGITDARVWNEAAQLGLVFKVAFKGESIWAQWTWAHHIKSRYFWTMKIPNDCSWVWISVLNAREKAQKFIKYSISDGKDTWFWHDRWVLDTPLLRNSEAKSCMTLPLNAKVSMLITNNKWNSLVQNLPDGQLKEAILSTEINHLLEKDRVIWTLEKSGMYTIKSAYNALRKKRQKVMWHRLVWGKWVIPGHSFISWLLLSDNLQTQDRLVYRKVITASKCGFCKASRENTKHLFFDCPFSKRVWSIVKKEIGLGSSVGNSTDEWKSLIRLCNSKREDKEVIKVFICAVVYNIWKERNARRVQKKVTISNTIAHLLIRDMKVYIEQQAQTVRDSVELRVLLDNLGIHVTYKQAIVSPVQWERTVEGVMLINSDGSLRGTKTGRGGVLRDHEATVKLIYYGSGGHKSVLMQELRAIEDGMIACKNLRAERIAIQSDSLNAVKIIKGLAEAPWYCSNLVESIKRRMGDFNTATIMHICREANTVADYVAKLGEGCEETVYCTPPLDENLCKLVENDAIGTIYVRFSK